MFTLDDGPIDFLLGITTGAAALAVLLTMVVLVDLARTRRRMRHTQHAGAWVDSLSGEVPAASQFEHEAA